ncbi:MAG: LamG domain-containing protein, partial [Candidatus Heimdallarchaeaceae archaeon]
MLNDKNKSKRRTGILLLLFLLFVMNVYADAPTVSSPFIGAYSQEPLNESIVGYWRLEGTGLDETGINNGTLNNFDNTSISGLTTDGRVGSAMKFDGVDDKIIISDSTSMRFVDGDFSISMWFNIKEDNRLQRLIGTENSVATAKGWVIQRGADGDIDFLVNNGSAVDNIGVSFGTTKDKWYFVTAVVDSGNTIKLYVDGVEEDSTNLDGRTDFEKNIGFEIGSAENTADRFFNGTIDEVKIWNISLSAQEISDMYLNSSFEYYTNQDIGVSSNESSDVDIGDEDWLTTIVNWFVDGESLTVLNLPFDTIGLSNDGNESSTEDFSSFGNNGTVFGAVRTQTELNSFQLADSDLLGYWKLNKESNETKATDSSTYGNDGNAIGVNTNSTGRIKGGFSFDGVNDYIDLGNPINLDLNNTSFTISSWIKREEFGSDHAIIMAQTTASDKDFRLWIRSTDKVRFDYEVGNQGERNTDSVTLIDDNKWYHIVAKYVNNDSNYTELYINGVLESAGENAYAITTLNQDKHIGDASGNTVVFNGTIDEVSIWNKTLDATEIDELYRKGLEGKVGSAYSFDGTNDKIEIGGFKDLDGATQMSISSWIYPLDPIGGNDIIIDKNNQMSRLHYQSTRIAVTINGK